MVGIKYAKGRISVIRLQKKVLEHEVKMKQIQEDKKMRTEYKGNKMNLPNFPEKATLKVKLKTIHLFSFQALF